MIVFKRKKIPKKNTKRIKIKQTGKYCGCCFPPISPFFFIKPVLTRFNIDIFLILFFFFQIKPKRPVPIVSRQTMHGKCCSLTSITQHRSPKTIIQTKTTALCGICHAIPTSILHAPRITHAIYTPMRQSSRAIHAIRIGDVIFQPKHHFVPSLCAIRIPTRCASRAIHIPARFASRAIQANRVRGVFIPSRRQPEKVTPLGTREAPSLFVDWFRHLNHDGNFLPLFWRDGYSVNIPQLRQQRPLRRLQHALHQPQLSQLDIGSWRSQFHLVTTRTKVLRHHVPRILSAFARWPSHRTMEQNQVILKHQKFTFPQARE